MSLIHWWPLTGTATDKVGGGPSVSNPTYVSGKLGQALDSGAITGTAEQWNQWMDGGSISIALWAKIDATGSFSHGTPFFGNGSSGKRKFTLFSYSSSTDDLTRRTSLHYAWQHDGLSGYSTYATGVIEGFFEKDQWVHLCATQDAQAGIVRIYKNGTLVKEHTGLELSDKTFTTADPTYFRSNYNYMKVNDLRLYDHALSQAEVKELSKALVVHYTFDDILVESTTNIISGIKSAHGKASLESGRVKINWSPSGDDSYFMFNYTETIKANSVYTLSFDCEGLKPGEVATFAVSNLGDAYTVALKNGRNSLTFTAGSDLMNDINTHNRLFFDDKTRTNGAVFYLSKFQLEERDYVTLYTPTNREGKLTNETGYVNPSSVTDLKLSTVSNDGSYSGHFNGNTSYIDIPIIKSDMFTSDYTISFWVYPLDNGRAIYLGDYNGSTGLNFERVSGDNGNFRYYHGGSPNWYYSDAGAPVGQWTHLAVTYSAPPNSDTTGELLIYKNGICVNNNENNTQKNHTSTMTKTIGGTTRLGSDYRSTSTTDATPLQGYMDDFRYYATCLRKEDITALYKTKAYITDKGDIASGEFVEEEGSIKIQENHQCLSAEIFERPSYIETNGSIGYFDTQYIPTSNDYSIEVDVRIKNFSSFDTLAGFMYTGTTTPRCGIHIYSSKYMFGANATASATTPLPAADKGGERITLKARFKSGDQQFYRNGELIASNSTSFNHSSNRASIWILSRNNYTDGSSSSTAVNPTRAELYGAKIYEGTEEVRNYVPWYDDVLKTNCLYETHTRTVIVGQGVLNSAFDENKQAKFYNDGKLSGRQIIEI